MLDDNNDVSDECYALKCACVCVHVITFAFEKYGLSMAFKQSIPSSISVVLKAFESFRVLAIDFLSCLRIKTSLN